MSSQGQLEEYSEPSPSLSLSRRSSLSRHHFHTSSPPPPLGREDLIAALAMVVGPHACCAMIAAAGIGSRRRRNMYLKCATVGAADSVDQIAQTRPAKPAD